MEITKMQAAAISAEINAAVEAILARHGLEKGRVSTTYGAGYTFKVDAAAVNTGANGVNTSSKEAQAWLANSYFFGVKNRADAEAALGQKVTVGGRTLVFCGLNPRSTKYPFIVRNENGAMMKVGEELATQLPGYTAL